MTAVPHALTTLSRVKDYLSISDTSLDTVIDQLISRATDWFEQRTGRRFKETTYTEELYDGGDRILFLNQYPVNSLTTFEFRVTTIGDPSPVFQAFLATDFALYAKAGMIRFIFGGRRTISGVVHDGTTPKDIQSIRVTYDAGFLIDFDNENDPAQHTLPFDIEDFIIRLVARRVNQKNASGVASESVEGASITWASPTGDQLSFDDKQIIDRYTKKTITTQLAQ